MTVESKELISKLLEREITTKKSEITEVVREYSRPENQWRGISQLTLEHYIHELESYEQALKETQWLPNSDGVPAEKETK